MNIRINPILLLMLVLLLCVGVYRSTSIIAPPPRRRGQSPHRPPQIEITPEVYYAAARRVVADLGVKA